jgi:hypothetical protein
MSGYYFNTESLLEIDQELESIKNNPGLSNDQKVDLVEKFLSDLDPERKREFIEFQNYMRVSQGFKEDKFIGQPELKNKYALVEFEHLQFNYSIMFGMIGSIMYQQTRLKDYKCSDEVRGHIQDYLVHTFGNYSDKYIGTIYDLYYKENKAKYPDYIPDIDNTLKELMPTPEQVKNFTDFCTNKLEEIRATTTALTGYKPSQEATIRVHGIFNNTDKDFVEYRDANFLNYEKMTELVMVPIGQKRLVQPFREFRTNVTIFNPEDKDVEILHSNKLVMNSSQYKNFNNRLSSLEGRLSKEEAAQYKRYKIELKELEKIPKSSDDSGEVAKKIEFVKKNIKDIQEAVAQDGEVITNVITFDRVNNKTEIVETIAKKEGELDIF